MFSKTRIALCSSALFGMVFVPLITESVNSNTNATTYHQIYVLGDSLSDAGALMGAGTQFLSRAHNFPAKKVEFGDSKVYQNGKQFCNGDVAVQHLANSLGLSISPAWHFELSQQLGGVYDYFGNDYAVGDSQAAIGTTQSSIVLDNFTSEMQREALIKQHADKNGKLNKNDLVVYEAGNNDLFSALSITKDGQGSKMTPEQQKIADDAVAAERSVINKLINENGANHLLVANVADLSLTPRFREGTKDHAIAQTLTTYYNANWQKMIDEFINKDPNLIKPFDVFHLFQSKIKEAAKIGMNITDNTVTAIDINFQNVINLFKGDGEIPVTYADNKTAADIDKDVFLDVIHPTEWLQKNVGEAMFKAVVNW